MFRSSVQPGLEPTTFVIQIQQPTTSLKRVLAEAKQFVVGYIVGWQGGGN